MSIHNNSTEEEQEILQNITKSIGSSPASSKSVSGGELYNMDKEGEDHVVTNDDNIIERTRNHHNEPLDVIDDPIEDDAAGHNESHNNLKLKDKDVKSKKMKKSKHEKKPIHEEKPLSIADSVKSLTRKLSKKKMHPDSDRPFLSRKPSKKVLDEPEETEGHVKLLARKGSWRGSIEVLLQRKSSKKNLRSDNDVPISMAHLARTDSSKKIKNEPEAVPASERKLSNATDDPELKRKGSSKKMKKERKESDEATGNELDNSPPKENTLPDADPKISTSRKSSISEEAKSPGKKKSSTWNSAKPELEIGSARKISLSDSIDSTDAVEVTTISPSPRQSPKFTNNRHSRTLDERDFRDSRHKLASKSLTNSPADMRKLHKSSSEELLQRSNTSPIMRRASGGSKSLFPPPDPDDEIEASAIKDSIFTVQTHFFYDMDPHLVYYTLLRTLANLLNCNYGFMGKVFYKNERPSSIKIWAIFNELTPTTNQAPRDPEIKIKHFSSLCGMVVSTKQVIHSNTPYDDPRGEPGIPDLPDPQPHIDTMLCIPFFSGPSADVLAVAVVCNRPKGFLWQQVISIRPYLQTCSNLIEAYNNHQTIKNQNEKKRSSGSSRKRSISLEAKSSVERDKKEERKGSFSAWFHNSMLSPANSKTKGDVSPSTSPKLNRTGSSSKLSSSPPPSRHHASFDLQHFAIKRKAEILSLRSKSTWELLRECIEQKDSKTLKKRLKIRKFADHINDVNGTTLLHYAITKDDHDNVETLLSSGVDVNLRDSKGFTPLHVAAELGNTRIILALLAQDGIDTNSLSNSGATPFHYFCGRFSAPSSLRRIFDSFLARKTDINAQDTVNGEFPLHKATLNPSVRLLIVKLLLEHGATVNSQTFKGDTALHYAVRMNRKDLVFELLGANADINLKNKEEKTPFDLAIEDNCSEQITKRLSDTQDLITWFERIGLQQYAYLFVRESIFKDVLHMVDEKLLIDLGIQPAGDRIRILSACNELKQKRQERIESMQSNNNSMRGMRQRPMKKQIVIMPTLQSTEEMKNNLGAAPSDWIPYTKLEFTKLLGSGAAGQVYKGLYDGQDAAIKVFETKFQEFEQEYKIFSSVRGPNIVGFCGACIEPRVCLVMEFCARGSLYDVLNSTHTHIGWKELIGFAVQMVRGLQSLHNNKPQILHRDVKSMNFLVDRNWVVKVADFGSARVLQSSNMSTLHKLRGTMMYCSPEVCKGEQYTEKSDIYSLAIVLWEMVNRCCKGKYEKPYAENNFENSIQIVMQTPKGLRPTLPAQAPSMILDVVKDCWDNDQLKRPNTDQLLVRLEECQKDLLENPLAWEQYEIRRPSIDSPEMLHLSPASSFTPSPDLGMLR